MKIQSTDEADPPDANPRGEVVRALGLTPATSVILANIIGTGVFVKARVMTCNVGTPGMVLTVWLVAGLLSLAGALVFAELSTMMPRTGGQYNFIGAAYGRRWAFLFGWTTTVAMGASVAALSIISVVFFNDLMGGSLSPLTVRLLPIVLIVVGVVLNFASVRSSGRTVTVLTAVKVALVLVVAAGAFLLADGSWSNFTLTGAAGTCEGVPNSAKLGLGGFGAAMLGALWSYNGWQVITVMGGEVKDPSRNLPRVLIGGTLLVMALYLTINAAYFYVLTPLEVASVPESSSVALEAASRFLGRAAAAILSVGLMISGFGTLHSTLLVGSRLPYALARNGLFPATLGTLSATSVPVFGVLALGTWSIVLAGSGTFDVLTDIYIFVLWIFFGMSGASVFVLRRKWPRADRPYRTLGYPVVPTLFLLVTAYLLINTLFATPLRALAGLLLVAAGLPVYAYYSRKIGPEDAKSWLGSGTR